MVKEHHVRVYKSEENLPREDQLAYKIAQVAADPVAVTDEVTDMVINRVIDNASVAIASLNRAPIVAARAQALTHGPTTGGKGSKVFGIEERVAPEWAAWANGVAVRELDYHDTFLAADYSHPGDNIPPILAVAQHVGLQRPGPDPRHRHRLRDPGQPGQGHLPAQAQDRPRRAPRPLRRRRHRHPAGPRRRDDLPVRRPGPAHHHRHPAVPQGRDLHLEGPRPGVRRQDGRRVRGPCHARPDLPGADLRRRRRRHRLDAGRPRRLLHGAAADRRRGQARHHGHLHQGALGRIPGPGVDRPRPQAPRRAPGGHRPGQRGVGADQDQPPHALRDRLRRQRPAEVQPHGQPRDAGPLDPVHLHRRPAGRRLAPRRFLRPGARRAPGHRGALAQGHHGRGPGMDPPLPLPRHRGEGLRRLRGDHAEGRHGHHRRDRRRRRPPAGRPAVRPGAVRRTSSAPSPPGWSPKRRSNASWPPPPACPSWPPASWTSSTSRPPTA